MGGGDEGTVIEEEINKTIPLILAYFFSTEFVYQHLRGNLYNIKIIWGLCIDGHWCLFSKPRAHFSISIILLILKLQHSDVTMRILDSIAEEWVRVDESFLAFVLFKFWPHSIRGTSESVSRNGSVQYGQTKRKSGGQKERKNSQIL
jgi:hypothetical protein